MYPNRIHVSHDLSYIRVFSNTTTRLSVLTTEPKSKDVLISPSLAKELQRSPYISKTVELAKFPINENNVVDFNAYEIDKKRNKYRYQYTAIAYSNSYGIMVIDDKPFRYKIYENVVEPRDIATTELYEYNSRRLDGIPHFQLIFKRIYNKRHYVCKWYDGGYLGYVTLDINKGNYVISLPNNIAFEGYIDMKGGWFKKLLKGIHDKLSEIKVEFDFFRLPKSEHDDRIYFRFKNEYIASDIPYRLIIIGSITYEMIKKLYKKKVMTLHELTSSFGGYCFWYGRKIVCNDKTGWVLDKLYKDYFYVIESPTKKRKYVILSELGHALAKKLFS